MHMPSKNLNIYSLTPVFTLFSAPKILFEAAHVHLKPCFGLLSVQRPGKIPLRGISLPNPGCRLNVLYPQWAVWRVPSRCGVQLRFRRSSCNCVRARVRSRSEIGGSSPNRNRLRARDEPAVACDEDLSSCTPHREGRYATLPIEGFKAY